MEQAVGVVGAQKIRAGQVWWLPIQEATVLVLRVALAPTTERVAIDRIEIMTLVQDSHSMRQDIFTYRPWENVLVDAILLREPGAKDAEVSQE